MNLLYETEFPSFEQEINESNGSKKYKIRGIFSSPDKKNKNGRIYPMHIWEREVAKYQDVIKSGHPNSLMELDHPQYSDVDMLKAVAKINKLWIENGYVMGEATLLDNPQANQLKTLIDNGIKMAVSTRGVGRVGQNGIVEEYRLITTDIIPNLKQSDHMAEMMGITEGILTEKQFEYNEETDSIIEICSKNVCTKEKKEVVQKAILESFKKLFEEQDKSETKKSITGLTDAIRRLSLQEFKYLLEYIMSNDKFVKVSELIYLIDQYGNMEELFNQTIVTELRHEVQGKKYVKGEEK